MRKILIGLSLIAIILYLPSCMKIGRYSIELLSPKDGAENVSLTPVLTWKFSSPFPVDVKFDVYLSGTSSFSNPIAKDIKDSYYVPSLESGKTYYWKVVAKAAAGTYESKVWSFTTVKNNPPEKPTLVSPKNGSKLKVKVHFSWSCSDPDGDKISYRLLLSESSDMASPTIVDGIESTSVNLELMPLTKYYWKVIATDEKGLSSKSDIWSFQTEDFPPTKPVLTYPKIGEKNVPLVPTLRWYSIDPEGSPVTYNLLFGEGETALSTILENSTLNYYKFPKKLSINTKYYWRVIAFDVNGNESESEIGYFKTLYIKNDPPSTPEIIQPEIGKTDLALSNITFSWTLSTDPEGKTVTYDLYLGKDKEKVQGKSQETLIASDLTNSQYTYTETLDQNTTYYWMVVAKDDMNQVPSKVASFTTKSIAPLGYVYSVGGKNRLDVIDFTDPLHPKFVRKLSKPSENYCGVAVNGNYLYVSYSDNTGSKIGVYDISSDKSNPKFVKSVNGDCDLLKVYDNYLVVFNRGGWGASVYDISNPTTPKKLYNVSMRGGGNMEGDIAYENGKLFLMTSGWDPSPGNFYELKVLNIKTGSVILDKYENPTSWESGIEVIGNYMYTLRRKDKWSGTVYLVVYDISDLNNIKELKAVPLKDDWTFHLYKDKSGSFLYATTNDYRGGVYKINVTDPSNPYLESHVQILGGWVIDISDSRNYILASLGWGGLVSIDKDTFSVVSKYDKHVFWPGILVSVRGYLYVASADDIKDLLILDRNLNEIKYYKTFFDDDWIRSMTTFNDKLYVGGSSKLYTVDVSDPENPKILSTNPISGDVRDMKVSNGKLYILFNSSLGIYNLSNPDNPTLERTIPLPNDMVRYMEIIGNSAIVGSDNSDYPGIYVIDLENSRITYSDGSHYTTWIVKKDNYAIIGLEDNRGTSNISVMDLTDPTRPKTVRNLSMDYERKALVYGNYLFTWRNGLKIYNASNPANLYFVSTTFEGEYEDEDGEFAMGSDNQIYIVVGGKDLLSVDISNPEKSEVISYEDLFDSDQSVAVGE